MVLIQPVRVGNLLFLNYMNLFATTMILSHNHPSGNIIPSLADEQLTLKMKQAAKMHDITVADHLIITSESYFSFADKGLL